VAGLPAPLDFNGCDTKAAPNEPAEVHTNPGNCRTFAASDFLRAAERRFFTTETNSLGDALRGDVEFSVYCWALFHLKAGCRAHPSASLFEWDRDAEPTLDTIADGFDRAIAFALAQEAAS
jgi:hypothetical protein